MAALRGEGDIRDLPVHTQDPRGDNEGLYFRPAKRMLSGSGCRRGPPGTCSFPFSPSRFPTAAKPAPPPQVSRPALQPFVPLFFPALSGAFALALRLRFCSASGRQKARRGRQKTRGNEKTNALHKKCAWGRKQKTVKKPAKPREFIGGRIHQTSAHVALRWHGLTAAVNRLPAIRKQAYEKLPIVRCSPASSSSCRCPMDPSVSLWSFPAVSA